jgi:hypothetical protein
MKKILVTGLLCLGITTTLMALFGSHGQKFDWRALELSQLQQQQIEQIEQAYQAEFQRIRKYSGSNTSRNEQLLDLRSTMISEIQSLLSAEQKQLASAMMAERIAQRESKRLQLQGRKIS